jgi:hypothetical protein
MRYLVLNIKNNGEATCCRIGIYEKIVLPPISETIVAGRAMDPIVKGMTGIVESVNTFVENHGLLIAKAVVQPNCGFIPIQILNISDQEHVLQKNYIAAQLEPIEIDMIEECHNINAVNYNVQRDTIQWPEHIKTIFDNNLNELAENQKVSFKNLLLKFQDSFSKSSTDIGRIEMIEHTIDTGQAFHVKQHPHRVPLSKIQEAEAEFEKMAEEGIIETLY